MITNQPIASPAVEIVSGPFGGLRHTMIGSYNMKGCNVEIVSGPFGGLRHHRQSAPQPA